MKKILIAITVIAGIFGLLILSGYNGLVGGEESVNKAIADVETQYQRRADLVPNLVSTVKGASDFEQETLTAVTEARANATKVNIDPSNVTPEELAEFQSAQGELSQALGRLLAVSESYPELKSVQTFTDLQAQLEGTENRIAVARSDFNAEATKFNTKIRRFPTNITASIFGFDRYPLFEADQGAETVPDVNFE